MSISLYKFSQDGRMVEIYYLVFLFLCSALLFLTGLGNHDLWNPDEPRVAGIVAEMAREGNMVVPRLNGKPFLEKPPLYFWVSSKAMNLLGETAYTARITSALAAVFGVLVTCLLARSMGFSPFSAFLAGLILATSVQYWALARRCLIDMLLCLFTTCAMASYFLATRHSREIKTWSVIFMFSLSCAVMTKGLVGLAIPLCAIGAWLIVRRQFTLRPWYLLFVASAICLIPLAIWAWFLYGELGWEGVHKAMWMNNFGRFLGARDSHVRPFYYYFTNFPFLFMPWTLFVPLAVVQFWKGKLGRGKEDSFLFILAWLIAPLFLLTLSAGKRGIYLLPLYPAAALLVGVILAKVLEGQDDPGKWYCIPFLILLGAVFLAGSILIGVGVYFKQSLAISLLLPLPVFCLSTVAVWCYIKGNMFRSFGLTVAALCTLFIVAEWGVYSQINQKKSYRPLLQYCKQLSVEGKKIGLFEPKESMRGAAVFYLKRTFPELYGAEEAMQFLESGEDAVILSRKKKVRSYTEYLRVLAEFGVGGKTYVLVKKTQTATGRRETKINDG